MTSFAACSAALAAAFSAARCGAALLGLGLLRLAGGLQLLALVGGRLAGVGADVDDEGADLLLAGARVLAVEG